MERSVLRDWAARLVPDFAARHPGCAHSLARRAVERLERQRHAVRRHHVGDIERHRDGGVVAAHADEIDYALLAEQRERAVEGRIVDLARAVKLYAEIVNRRLVVLHGGGPLAERE